VANGPNIFQMFLLCMCYMLIVCTFDELHGLLKFGVSMAAFMRDG